jgi:isopentenyl diphosphate isomerase/L-lactate dehydrogenase-like FMN-dependent dehydrogenase
MLDSIVKAINGKVPVIYEGGIRRGTDILKVLAIGAKAVIVEKPVVWGISAGGYSVMFKINSTLGQTGIERVVTILKDELTNAMGLSGCPTIKDITNELIFKSSQPNTAKL